MDFQVTHSGILPSQKKNNNNNYKFTLTFHLHFKLKTCVDMGLTYKGQIDITFLFAKSCAFCNFAKTQYTVIVKSMEFFQRQKGLDS